MARVMAMTIPDPDRRIPSRVVEGELAVHRVDSLDYEQYTVEGVDVDPDSVVEVEDVQRTS